MFSKQLKKLVLLTGISLSALSIQAVATDNLVSAKEYKIAQADVTAVTLADKNAFYEKYGAYASELSKKHNVYASVMLAQMALESNYGKSALAKSPANNFFGVKGSYNDNYVVKATKEDDGSGNMYTINAKFKAYPSYKKSMEDYINVIKKSIYMNAWVSNTKTYKDATKALTGVYASDTQYNNKLNKIIVENNLTRFDKVTPADFETKISYATYTVAKGDNLYQISNKYKMTVNEIKALNGLKNNNLNLGQALKVKITTVAYIGDKVAKPTDSVIRIKGTGNSSTSGYNNKSLKVSKHSYNNYEKIINLVSLFENKNLLAKNVEKPEKENQPFKVASTNSVSITDGILKLIK